MDSAKIPAFIRPLQTSPFANLAVEILIEIEKKLKETFENAFERQTERMKFSGLCFSTRGASSGWKEVAVYDQRMVELADLLEEIGAGSQIKTITITNNESCSDNNVMPPPVEFGLLMKICKAVTELNLINSYLTYYGVGALGVEEMLKNEVKIDRLSLRNSHEVVVHDCFLPLFKLEYPAHVILEDLAEQELAVGSIPTRFISLELIDTKSLNITTLAQLLATSIGFIRELSFETLLISNDQGEQEFKKLFQALGTSLTHLKLEDIFAEGALALYSELGSLLPPMQILERLILEEGDNIDSSIFQVISRLPRLEEFSLPFCDATLPQELEWPFLEFIRNSSNNLKIVSLSSDKYEDEALKSKMVDRREELINAAKVSNVELEFPAEWNEQ